MRDEDVEELEEILLARRVAELGLVSKLVDDRTRQRAAPAVGGEDLILPGGEDKGVEAD